MANFFAQAHEALVREGALEHGVHEPADRRSRLVTVLLVAAIAASALSMLFSIGTAALSARSQAHADAAVGTLNEAGPAPAGVPWGLARNTLSRDAENPTTVG